MDYRQPLPDFDEETDYRVVREATVSVWMIAVIVLMIVAIIFAAVWKTSEWMNQPIGWDDTANTEVTR